MFSPLWAPGEEQEHLVFPQTVILASQTLAKRVTPHASPGAVLLRRVLTPSSLRVFRLKRDQIERATLLLSAAPKGAGHTPSIPVLEK